MKAPTTAPMESLAPHSGQFWVGGLPLLPSANVLTLTASDAVGNVRSQTLTLNRSSVTLTIHEPSEAELASNVILFPYSYSLTAIRDFTTSPRHTVLPDATVTMSWGHASASTMDTVGNMAECFPSDPPPPPDTIMTEGIEYRWPAAGNGTSRRWMTTFGNTARQYDPAETSERPPNAVIDIPQERCSGFVATRSDPPFTGTFTRNALTVMHLKSDAPTWPKPQRSVSLVCRPTDITVNNEPMLAVTAWSTGCNLGEPNTWYRETGVSIDPAVTPIVIDGQRINPDGSVLVKVNKVGEKPVTPDVQDNGIKWYRYGLTVGPIKPVTLTWSAHPLITATSPTCRPHLTQVPACWPKTMMGWETGRTPMTPLVLWSSLFCRHGFLFGRPPSITRDSTM